MTTKQWIELIPYICFGLSGLIISGSLLWMAWRLDHPKKDRTPPRRGGGMLL